VFSPKSKLFFSTAFYSNNRPCYNSGAAEIRIVTTFITSNAKEIIEGKLKSNAWVKVK